MSSHANARLEAFCDGVFAIALTLLIIEIRLPADKPIHSTGEFWRALGHVKGQIFAFLLSFAVILITWVNHHGIFKLIHKSSPAFMYANGLMLLTVVFIPFPTALMGEYLMEDYAAPAVVLYDAVIACQAIAWILLGGAALRDGLTKDAHAASIIRNNRSAGYVAFLVYGGCAVAALWVPLLMALLTAALWVFWLIYGISAKNQAAE